MMRDVARLNVGWAALWIGLHWAFLALLPMIAVSFIYFAKTGALSTPPSKPDPHIELFSVWGNIVWISLGAFWSCALTAYTAPDGDREHEGAPVPFFLGLSGLLIFELLIVLALGIHASPMRWLALSGTFFVRILVFTIGIAAAIAYGKAFGQVHRRQESGLGIWLLEHTRSATVGKGLNGPIRYSL